MGARVFDGVRWSGVMAWVMMMSIDGEAELTAPSIRASTSQKPTTDYRRIYVDPSLMLTSTKDPFQKKVLCKVRVSRPSFIAGSAYLEYVAGRKLESYDYKNLLDIEHSSNIWNWDTWCRLQARSGNCTEIEERYYYDLNLNKCSTFTYSGCSGNKNNFNGLLDCERHCNGASFMDTIKCRRPAYCSLQPDAGRCLALMTRYYWDVNENICKEFIYGGCGGNQNRFHTLYKCMKHCAGKSTK